jgi:hypothetical protein
MEKIKGGRESARKILEKGQRNGRKSVRGTG